MKEFTTRRRRSQQTRNISSLSVQRWPTVTDVGPTLGEPLVFDWSKGKVTMHTKSWIYEPRVLQNIYYNHDNIYIIFIIHYQEQIQTNSNELHTSK